MTVGSEVLSVSGSVGLAVSRGGDVSAADLLRNADVAMYLAKENGRARWELFDGLGPELLALRSDH